MKTVIEMAREAGMNVVDDQYSLLPFLERFAELVRADERNDCSGLDFRMEVGLTSEQDYKYQN